MPSLTDAVKEAFGQVKFGGNEHFKLSGSGNSGVIQNNCNFDIISHNSQFNLSNSDNGELELNDVKLDMLNCCNANIRATGGSISLNGETNADLKVNGTNLILSNNTNATIITTGGSISAMDNINLTVLGANGNVCIQNTKDNEVLLSTTGENKLTFEFKPDRSNRFNWGPLLTSWWSNGGESRHSSQVKRTVEYLDRADIQGNSYATGIFHYSINPRSEAEFEVKVHGKGLDIGPVETVSMKQSQVLLSATRNGVKQSFVINAPSIISQNCTAEEARFNVKMYS